MASDVKPHHNPVPPHKKKHDREKAGETEGEKLFRLPVLSDQSVRLKKNEKRLKKNPADRQQQKSCDELYGL